VTQAVCGRLQVLSAIANRELLPFLIHRLLVSSAQPDIILTEGNNLSARRVLTVRSRLLHLRRARLGATAIPATRPKHCQLRPVTVFVCWLMPAMTTLAPFTRLLRVRIYQHLLVIISLAGCVEIASMDMHRIVLSFMRHVFLRLRYNPCAFAPLLMAGSLLNALKLTLVSARRLALVPRLESVISLVSGKRPIRQGV
jgi:hypothetical protein